MKSIWHQKEQKGEKISVGILILSACGRCSCKKLIMLIKIKNTPKPNTIYDFIPHYF